ncbi:Phage protein [Yersinia phage fHe-Yen9-04]|uniref:Phage protein n=2 Tax=Eneladusvirus Yen904 TaxID=2560849 RepID=A0A2C9CXU2_9CAUD|nr:Phage protein [Yersinia phage fHe-Yen9-04]SOK58650.1 Phage protein [Yersinia phage fHe-Yen9-04]SOK59184.1 Phage protein [Yersinia phage fHe-Yen9-03]VUE36419.1 Phage protein [Yersinia phage fHe-Yen9-04]
MYSAIEDEVTPLKELGFEVIPFGMIPFTNTMTGIDDLDPDDFYIIRGGTKVVQLLDSGTPDNLSPELISTLRKGISYNQTMFDQAHYSSNGLLPLLNSTPTILDLSKESDLYASFSTPKFVKPSSDLKAFTAGIMDEGEVLKYFIEKHYYRTNYAEETALVHDVVEIDAEYRFICLNGEVITGSMYRKNDQLVLSSKIPKIILDTADEYALLYHPSEIYTMDLAETPNGIKIVEYNCWNGSGLYKMDTKKLFSTIHEYYKGKL